MGPKTVFEFSSFRENCFFCFRVFEVFEFSKSFRNLFSRLLSAHADIPTEFQSRCFLRETSLERPFQATVFEPFQSHSFRESFRIVFEKTVFEFSRKTVFEPVFVITFLMFSRKLFSRTFKRNFILLFSSRTTIYIYIYYIYIP